MSGSNSERNKLERTFEETRANAKWSIDGECLSELFFFDPSETKLEAAGKTLVQSGYRFGKISLLKEGTKKFMLRVEREEKHTVDSLLRREKELSDFAAAQGIRSYDGWGVGPMANGQCRPAN